MEFYDVINRRRSVRSYDERPIPSESLNAISQAVREAPSACNKQPWRFDVILNAHAREAICGVYTQPWLREAPAIVVAIGDYDEAWKRLDGESILPMDVGIAMEHMVLAAAAEGLGTCWICAYDVKKMNHALDLKSPKSALAITPLGYPAKLPGEIQRKSLDQIFRVVG